MSSIDDRIAEEIRTWPSLYGRRADVLHKWFCVNSDGWQDGELIGDVYGSEKRTAQELRIIDFSKDNLTNYVNIQHNLSLKKEQFISENADLLARIPVCMEDPLSWIYPMSDDCNLVSFSESIKSGYKEAILETICMVFRVRTSAEYGTFSWVDNKMIAEAALKRYQSFFGNNEGFFDYESWVRFSDKKRFEFEEKIKRILGEND